MPKPTLIDDLNRLSDRARAGLQDDLASCLFALAVCMGGDQVAPIPGGWPGRARLALKPIVEEICERSGYREDWTDPFGPQDEN